MAFKSKVYRGGTSSFSCCVVSSYRNGVYEKCSNYDKIFSLCDEYFLNYNNWIKSARAVKALNEEETGAPKKVELELDRIVPIDKNNPIEQIILKTARIGFDEENGLIFPIYSPLKKEDNQMVKRVSEQELKQEFIKYLSKFIKKQNEENKWFYSVETPTIGSYDFKQVPKIADTRTGTSARVDLTVFDKYEMVKDEMSKADYAKYSILSHIEFKQGSTVRDYDIIKDLLKLSYEPYCNQNMAAAVEREKIEKYYGGNLKEKTHYFIHFVDSFKKSDLEKLTDKYFGLDGLVKKWKIDGDSPYADILECLKNSMNHIYIYVVAIENNISVKQIDNNNDDNSSRICFKIAYDDILKKIANNEKVDLNEIWTYFDLSTVED